MGADKGPRKDWVWMSAKTPLWVKFTVGLMTQIIKNYSKIPGIGQMLMAFGPILDPLLDPFVRMLDYFTLKYMLQDYTFGGKRLKFTGNFKEYWCLIAKSTWKTWSTCTIWFNFLGGKHVVPTYLDEHLCWEDEDREPGNRWRDHKACKEHFKNVRKSVLGGEPFEDYMYISQITPAMPFCEALKHTFCGGGFGGKAKREIDNSLRYLRIGGKPIKFTGTPEGLKKTQAGCCFKVLLFPIYYLMDAILGIYSSRFNNYVDAHIEWTTLADLQAEFAPQGSKVAPGP